LPVLRAARGHCSQPAPLVSGLSHPPAAVILALPATAEALPSVRALQPLRGALPVPGVVVAAVLTAV
jgi:hypothetical protein